MKINKIRAKIRTFLYIIKQSFFNVIRNKMMLVASLIIMIATMFIFGSFYVLSRNVTHQIDNVIKSEYEISVNLDSSISDEQAVFFEDILKKDDRIERYKMISKSEAYKEFKSNWPEEEFNKVFPDENSDFLPVSFNIKLKDSKDSASVVKDLMSVKIGDLKEKADEGPADSPSPSGADVSAAASTPGATPSAVSATTTDDVEIDDDSRDAVWEIEEVDTIIKTIKSFSRTVGIIFTIILGLLSFYSIVVISNTVMLTVMARKREIVIMQNIGATSAYIRGPFIIEGCLIGIIGAAIAFFIVGEAYNALSATITRELSGSLFRDIELLDFNLFRTELMIYFIIFSSFIGGFGALVSVNKHIKSK